MQCYTLLFVTLIVSTKGGNCLRRMPVQPARVMLAQESPCAWRSSPLLASASIAAEELSTASPTRNGRQTPSAAVSPAAQSTRFTSAAVGKLAAASATSSFSQGLRFPAQASVLAEYLRIQQRADKAVSTLLNAGQRRRARRQYCQTLAEWKETRRGMMHLLERIQTAYRDATWRWKLLQSFVIKADCIAGYMPPPRNVCEEIVVKSRLPPSAPRLPTAADLRSMEPSDAFQHLVTFQAATDTYLRTTWVPDEEEHLSRAELQLRDLSLRRACALLHLPEEELKVSRLGATIAHKGHQLAEDVKNHRIDKLLLEKERATTSNVIRPEFSVAVEEREALDPKVRLDRVKRYGWMVREGLYARAQEDVIDSRIESTYASLTPREKAKSVLLDIAPLERVIDSSPSRRGSPSWDRSVSPTRTSVSGFETRNRFVICRRLPEETPHVMDFSFCDIEVPHQLLIAEPRSVITGQSEAGPAPQSHASSNRRRSSAQQLRRGRSFAAGGDADAKAAADAMHKLKLHVFTEKDDNPVALQQKFEALRRAASPTGGTAMARRRSFRGELARSASFASLSKSSIGGVPSDISHGAQQIVARRYLSTEDVAYLDHPALSPFLTIVSKYLGFSGKSKFGVQADVDCTSAFHVLKLNDNRLGGETLSALPRHRFLPESDPKRGTRYDPDLVVWKELLAGTDRSDVSRLCRLPLFVKSLVGPVHALHTVDLSGNMLQRMPLELLEELPALLHFNMQRNRVDSLRSVALAAGLLSSRDNSASSLGAVHVKLTPPLLKPSDVGSSLRWRLLSFSLAGNPVTERGEARAYRRAILLCFPSLQRLDGISVVRADVEEALREGSTVAIS